MAGPHKAYSRARPVRVAYLISNHEHSGAMLDAIFQESMGRWGGRFSLLVPSTEIGPAASYQRWLRAYDPDVIYSYVDLNPEAIERLHEELYPSFLVLHEQRVRGNDARSYRPRLPIDGLSATTLIPLAAAPTFTHEAGTSFLDVAGRMYDDALVRDSFGSFLSSVGRSFGPPLTNFGQLVTLVADGDCEPRERYFRPGDPTVNSAAALLELMSAKRIVTMSQLSSMFAPRISYGRRRWPAFNLVVGDRYTDRVFYWNERLNLPVWRDGDFVDLRVPTSCLDDGGVQQALSKFLQRRNHVTLESGSSTPRVVVRSSSVARELLDKLAHELKGRTWIDYSVELISSVDDCVPDQRHLETAGLTLEGAFPRAAPEWLEHYCEVDELRLTPPAPSHLKHCPPALQSPYQGTWAVDLDIERSLNNSAIDNVVHHWRFPRRLRLTSSFTKGYQIDSPNSSIMMPRVSSPGLLTLFANAGSKFPVVHLPNDEDAIFNALVSGRDWWPFKHDPKAEDGQLPRQLLTDVLKSENGRYFAGVFGMFTSLTAAGRVLLHQFWREEFEKLGANPSLTDRRREIVEVTLKKRLSNPGPSSSRDIGKLADIVLQEAEYYRTAVPCRPWDELKKSFGELQKRYQLKHKRERTEQEIKEDDERELLSLKRATKNLCSLGLLYQGYEHRCRDCLHTSWIAIGRLTTEVECEVCRRREPAPVDRPWQFRLKEFVREALRKHGVLPLFWSLLKIRNAAQSSFFYVGPTEIYLDGTRWDRAKGDTDIDLICVTDGLVRMCEVKQSARQLRKAKAFAKLMIKLRPDIATIAVMEPETAAIKSGFEQIRTELAGTGIQSELLTLEPDDFDDNPYLWNRSLFRIGF